MENTQNSRAKTFFTIILIFIFQLIVYIWFGTQKNTFFCDEIFSYGLANSINHSFLMEEKTNEWFPSSKYIDYVTTSKDKIFDFEPAYVSQINDNHPPLYYYLIHIASSFSGDNFTKWTGIGLNFVILFFTNFIFFYIARFFLNDNKKALLAMGLWSFCAAGISNILFIRMYFLLTFAILTYIAAHIRLYKSNQFKIIDYIFILLAFMLGGLTHYYFYVFAVCFSFLYFCYLLYKNQKKQALCYAITLLCGLIFNTLHFPYMWKHIFTGYRGTEVFANLAGERTENVFLTSYLHWINTSLTGGFLFFLLLLGIIAVSLKCSCIKKDEVLVNLSFNKTSNTIFYLLTIFSTIFFLFITIKGSRLVSNRYIYPIYPILAIFLVSIIFYTLRQFNITEKIKNLIAIMLVIGLCYNSITAYGIDFLYPNYKELSDSIAKTKGYDCLLYMEKKFRDIYTGYDAKLNYDEVYMFDKYDIKNLKTILDKRRTKNPVVLDLPDEISDLEQYKLANEVTEAAGFKKNVKIYDFGYSTIYLLL